MPTFCPPSFLSFIPPPLISPPSPSSCWLSSCRTEPRWRTTGSCPAQLPDQKQDHFSTRDHIHSHLFNFLWDIFIFIIIFFLVPHPPHTERSIQAESFSFTKHTWCWTTAKQIFLLVLFVEQEQGNMQNDCIDSLKAELRTQCNRGEANKHSFSCPSFSLLSLWWLFLLLID